MNNKDYKKLIDYIKLMKEGYIEEASKINLKGLNLTEANLKGLNLYNAKLQYSNLSCATKR